jgi:UDP:flavonoid glycosyltransferase YjiC (YdhE family)
MATILFTWELGEGSGHIAPYIELIKKLEKDGHIIYFAARMLNKTHTLFKDTNVICLQSPTTLSSSIPLQKPIDSFAKILNNSGHENTNNIIGMISAWRNLYNIVKPDLIIHDFSPTAMLAARNIAIKSLQIGTGFYMPPPTEPIEGLAALQGFNQDQNELLTFEKHILGNINRALATFNISPLNKLSDINSQCDSNLLLGFEELDYYNNRGKTSYIGTFKTKKGAVVNWPKGNGPKIFMYIKSFPTLPQLLQMLNDKQLPTLIYADDVSGTIKQRFSSPTLQFSEKALDMAFIGETADIAICNATFSTTCELLCSGIPILGLPLHAEQHIVALNIERIGAGLCAAQKKPKGMQFKLEALINDSRYRKSAQQFAEKHKNTASNNALDISYKTITTLLKRCKND